MTFLIVGSIIINIRTLRSYRSNTLSMHCFSKYRGPTTISTVEGGSIDFQSCLSAREEAVGSLIENEPYLNFIVMYNLCAYALYISCLCINANKLAN